MKLKVLIDSISLLSPLTGIGRYTYEISKYLKTKDELDLSFFYGYHSKKLIEQSEKSNIKNFKSIITKNQFVKKLARKILFYYSDVFPKTYDVYWTPNFIPNPGIKAKKIITTIHDFSFILHKDHHPKERIEYFKNNFYKNIYNSDMIITGSNFTKDEILKRLDFDESKIKVIYHGINHNIFKVIKNPNSKNKLPSKFILSVGSIEPRKNLLGLLKAYNNMDKSIKEEYKLVLVGFKGWGNTEIMDIIDNNQDNIHYIGFISDEELAKVYNLASLFVFPSFYEGFGLPPLESFACGTPVISSNLSSMPEICQDAAIYINPYNDKNIKEKIEMVLKDKKLQKDMINKGLNRAKSFTWEKSAEKHKEYLLGMEK